MTKSLQHNDYENQSISISYSERLCYEVTRQLIRLAIDIKNRDNGMCRLIDSPLIQTFIKKLDQATEAFSIYEAGSEI